jgi:hypothetical protein
VTGRGNDPLDDFETCPSDLESRALVAGEIAFLSISVNRYIDWNLLHRHLFSQKNTFIGQIACPGYVCPEKTNLSGGKTGRFAAALVSAA